MRRDLVAEAAADVLRDEAELVEPRAHRGPHHDRGEAGELVVRVDRPLPGAAVVLDERAVALERRRVEAVEVQLVDLHDLVRLGERGVEVAPLVDALPHQVAAGVLVDRRHTVVARVARVGDRRRSARTRSRRARTRRARARASRRRRRRPPRRRSAPCRPRARSPSGSRPAPTRSGRTDRSATRPPRRSACRRRPAPPRPSRRRAR